MGFVGKESEVEGRAQARDVPWAPEFFHYRSRLIHYADNTSWNIGTAYGVLRACILPRDAELIIGSTNDLVGELAQSLLSVCFHVPPFSFR